MTRDVFEAVPIWVVFLISSLLIAAFMEMGHRLALWRSKNISNHDESSSGVAAGGIIGLVSFVLAFAFGIAASHNETRKTIILDEANIIGTAYLRTDLLTEPERGKAAGLLREYAQLRYDAATMRIDRPQFDAVLARSEEIHGELWQLVSTYALANPSPTNTLLLASVNDLIDMHTIRITKGVGGRIPASIWLTLYVLAGVGVISAAYAMSRNTLRRPILLPGLVLAFSGIITLIADLDNPRYGFLQNDQRPMESTLKSMQAGL